MSHGNNNCLSVTGAHLLLSESENPDLLQYASRISSLIERCPETNEPFLATLDDFLGAIYALMLAKGNNPAFVDRAGRVEKPAIVKRAREAALGRIRLSGPWLAGFHFNSALFRIAAVHHRSSQFIRRDDFPKWQHENVDRIHDDVNPLKHRPNGLAQKRTVTWAQAVAAVSELLKLFELWMSHQSQPSPQ